MSTGSWRRHTKEVERSSQRGQVRMHPSSGSSSEESERAQSRASRVKSAEQFILRIAAALSPAFCCTSIQYEVWELLSFGSVGFLSEHHSRSCGFITGCSAAAAGGERSDICD